ncbi:Hypothetical protein D9617_6g092840 [Elsinoe fawcettii]|nr:Hypothetical protein D9617_6g092840 [Elsinoe fawcettii]
MAQRSHNHDYLEMAQESKSSSNALSATFDDEDISGTTIDDPFEAVRAPVHPTANSARPTSTPPQVASTPHINQPASRCHDTTFEAGKEAIQAAAPSVADPSIPTSTPSQVAPAPDPPTDQAAPLRRSARVSALKRNIPPHLPANRGWIHPEIAQDLFRFFSSTPLTEEDLGPRPRRISHRLVLTACFQTTRSR